MFLLLGLGQNSFSQTSWIEKESGDGPWVIPGGIRNSTSVNLKDDSYLKAYDSDNIDIKKTTSDHAIIFSTQRSEINSILYQKQQDVPKMKF